MMEFIIQVMFLVSNVVIIVLATNVIYLLEKLVNSRYRNCSITLDEDQYDNLLFALRELARLN